MGPRWALLLCLVFVSVLAPGSEARPRSQADPTASPQADDLPPAPPPFGLADVALPNDPAAIRAFFERLPTSVAGQPRATPFIRAAPDRLRASYGEDDPALGHPLWLQALDVSTGEFFPAGSTAGQVAAEWALDPEAGDVDGYGRDGSLVWFRTVTTARAEEPGSEAAPERTLYGLQWGQADDPWLFGAGANTPQRLEALVAAFVVAAAPAATPAAGA